MHGRIRDRRDEPAESGYRAVHVIVIRDGQMIEIQLREPAEHEWAVVVERTGARLGFGLKEGEGPEDLKGVFSPSQSGYVHGTHGPTTRPCICRGVWGSPRERDTLLHEVMMRCH